MMFMKRLVVLFVWLKIVAGLDKDVCTTPLYQQGTCKLITKCPVLLDLLKNPSQTVISFLRKSQCGLEGRTPKVCCPDVVPEFGRGTEAGTTLLPTTEVCGQFFEDKLIGGEIATIGQYPFNAILKYKNEDNSERLSCGGTLINDRYVLTAAHCITAKLISVVLGEHNTNTTLDCDYYFEQSDCINSMEVPVEETIVHENYRPESPNRYHDIALVRLKKKVTYDDSTQPVCLSTSTEINQRVTVSGWGIFGTHSSNLKKRAGLMVAESELCSKILNFQLDENQFCAFQSKSYKSCVGDSGGAVLDSPVTHRGQNYYAVGILSMGSCDVTRPLVFTKVDRYVDWISRKLKP